MHNIHDWLEYINNKHLESIYDIETRLGFQKLEGNMHPYSTHIPILANCVARTCGPVIEFGCGDYSTPMLHMMCKNRELYSLENDKLWLEKFKDLESDTHKLVLVDDWLKSEYFTYRFGVAFVDNVPYYTRVSIIEKLMDIAQLIVIHDTDNETYGWSKILPKFKYRYDFKRYEQHACVVSNVVDLQHLFP